MGCRELETARAALEAETQTLGAQLSARQEEAEKLKSQVSVLNNMRVEAHQQLLAKGREVESAHYDMAAERARLEEEARQGASREEELQAQITRATHATARLAALLDGNRVSARRGAASGSRSWPWPRRRPRSC